MKYFEILKENDPAVVGVTPQVGLSHNYNELSSSIAHLNGNDIPHLDNYLVEYFLDDDALLTDVLTQAYSIGDNLLCSGPTIDILNSFDIGEHYVFSGSLDIGIKSVEVFFLHLISEWKVLSEYLDFGRSRFVIKDLFKQVKGHIQADDHQNYLRQRDSLASNCILHPDSLYISPSCPLLSRDLFVCFPYTKGILVSDRLKSALVEEGISGIKFREVNFFHASASPADA